MAGIDSYTKLMLHCDGSDGSTTFTDSSLSPHTMTPAGNAQIDTAQSKFGGASGLFDGSGDYVQTPSSTDWNFGAGGSGDFTIDLWYRLNSEKLNEGLIDTSGGGVGWYFNLQPTNELIELWNGPGTGRTVSFAMTTAIWYHVAVVRSGSTITIYVDGTSQGTVSDNDFNNDGNQLTVGGAPGQAASYAFDGWLDEVRISKGIARWTANFTPPTAAYSAGGGAMNRNMMMMGVC